MTDNELYWIEKCRTNKEDYVIIVDNDSAYVLDVAKLEDVFTFENWGWRLALDLFLHIGCNAEEA